MKNLTIFKTEPGWKPDASNMHISCPGMMGNSWKILRNNSPVIDVDGQFMLVMETQEKLIPSSTVKNEVDQRIAEFIKNTGDEAMAKGKKFRRDIKEQVIESLYAKAFVTSKYTGIWIDSKTGIMCIDTTSDSKIDDVLTSMRKNDFPAMKRVRTKYEAGSTMQKLLASEDQQENGFSVGQSCELVAEGQQSIRYKNVSLDTDEVRGHLLHGRRVKKLELTYQNKIVFTLHDNFRISGIKILEEIQDAEEYESAEAKFDADFAIMTGMYSELIGAVVEALGGEA